ncbi:MAG: putative rRNA maturation factor [candidate division TM6 bacterium GW2011_GWF2_28_16]|nr:MAG: putative rRNA maturation factor [candidate division TM6 bacterium GW2011_GWF2_28_16]
MILLKNTQKKIKIDPKYVKKQVQKILELLNYPNFDVNIWFTTNITIKNFNKKFRGKNKPTDILSFPFYPNLKQGEKIKAQTPEDQNLGDIIISLEYCLKDSKKLNLDFKIYLIRIITHGLVHLLGYDHITDQDYKVMHKLEQNILKKLFKDINFNY